jgi:uncharacterized protein (DUF427 family)
MKIEIANSKDALILREASYPPVIYIPRKDADMSRLERSEHTRSPRIRLAVNGEARGRRRPAASEEASARPA